MAPAFCFPITNSAHTAIAIKRYYAFTLPDADELSEELSLVWKLKQKAGCPSCGVIRRHAHASVGLCGRCQRIRRAIKRAEISDGQIPLMLKEWRDNNLSVEAHKAYKRAQELMDQGRRILRY